MRIIAFLIAAMASSGCLAAPERITTNTANGQTVCIGPFSDSDDDRDRYAALNRSIAADLIIGGYAVQGAASRWGQAFKSSTQEVLWMDHGFGPCITYSDPDGPKLDAVTRFPGL